MFSRLIDFLVTLLLTALVLGLGGFIINVIIDIRLPSLIQLPIVIFIAVLMGTTVIDLWKTFDKGGPEATKLKSGQQ